MNHFQKRENYKIHTHMYKEADVIFWVVFNLHLAINQCSGYEVTVFEYKTNTNKKHSLSKAFIRQSTGKARK